MKYFLVLILGIFVLNSNAQIPAIASNVSVKENSLIYKAFHKKYEFLIAYTIYGGWKFGDSSVIEIIAFNKGTWQRITLSFLDRDPDQQTVKKTPFDKLKAETLMQTLTKESFWALNNDSLNIREKKPIKFEKYHIKNDTLVVSASPVTRMSISDGATYYFQILQGDNLRTYSSEEPEAYLKFLPEIKSRVNFIRAKKAFEKALQLQ